MAVTTVATNLATLTGARGTSSTHIRTITTAGTIVIDTDNFEKFAVRITSTSTTAAVALTLGVGTEYSDIGLSNATVTLATANAAVGGLTASTTVIGGIGFEASRFKTSGGTIVITVPALPANTLYAEAIRLPN